ncbi:hypothetical protein L9F63_018748, partial [Diploptera punctata]
NDVTSVSGLFRDSVSGKRRLLWRREQQMDFDEHVYMLLAFLTTCFFLPVILLLYIVVNGTRSWTIKFLNRIFPKLEFIKNITVRTATDTSRNQGIITVLLTVKGTYDLNDIKQRIKKHILERKDKSGKLIFPHLKTGLTDRLGRYAWTLNKAKYFDIDSHVNVANSIYRGRFVSECNIQEYVSDIVAKYLPLEISPWQITIIPCYPPERFYLLIRIHHLLLSEEGLGLGDLLLLGPERQNVFTRLLDEDDENPQDVPPQSSPLTGLFQVPVAIPKLYNKTLEIIDYYWNQFVLSYDPFENPEVLKTKAGITKCTAIMFITSVSILKAVINTTKQSDASLFTKTININSIVFNEIRKRQCGPRFLAAAVMNSLNPFELISSTLKFFSYLWLNCLVRVPLTLMYELLAIIFKDESKGYFSTITENMFICISLIIEAAKEICYICSLIYSAPKMLLDELVISHRDPKHELQTVSLCGRKVVSWSESVPLDRIRRIGNSIGASPNEILITATTGALKEYFRNFGFRVPKSVLTTARYFPLESLLKISRGDDSSGPPSGRGLVCLELPTSQLQNDPREIVHDVQRMLKETRERQTAIYEASLWQLDGGFITKVLPTLAVRLIFNYLSRRYAVALTEVAPETGDESTKQLIWGQEVESAMYWRPPQSNICLSLTLMSYGDSVRLGIMADSMIAPGHNVIATNFLYQINMLAAVAEIPREANNVSTGTSIQSYQPNIPPDCAISSSASSASGELRRLADISTDLNNSTSQDTSRSNSPSSDSGTRSTRSSNEENIFPFTD